MTARLVLGTAQLAQPYGIANRTGAPDEATAAQMLWVAEVSGRILALDTAPTYGAAHEVIRRSGTKLPVFTKFERGVDPVESIECSLATLGRRFVELVFLHDPDVVLHDPDGTVERAHRAIRGRAAGLGASVYTIEQFDAAVVDPRISAVQVPVSVADQRIVGDRIDAAAASGTAVYARSVYLQGALLLEPDGLPEHLAPLRPLLERLRAAAAVSDRTVAEVCVAFVRDLPGITGVVLGAETTRQLADNLRIAASPPLDDDELARMGPPPDLPTAVIDPRTWPATAPTAPTAPTASVGAASALG